MLIGGHQHINVVEGRNLPTWRNAVGQLIALESKCHGLAGTWVQSGIFMYENRVRFEQVVFQLPHKGMLTDETFLLSGQRSAQLHQSSE